MIKNTEMYIVGIGASMGGLEAINMFFKSIPSKVGMAFVICEDLDSNNKRHLGDILEHHTQLEVKEITEKMYIEADNIYLIPQGKEVEINKNKFELYDKTKDRSIIIDRFFHSLGKEKKDKSIGVILSGIGIDGSDGVRTIHREKGIVIVQNEGTAEFIEKPRNVAATGVVDYVLPPSKMIEVILKRVNKENTPIEFLGAKEREEAFYNIIGIVKEYTGMDLLCYKKDTISNRIQERMNTLDIENPQQYLNYLRENHDEINNLYYTIYVGVTKFFRDEKAFKSLEEQVIHNLFKDKDEDSETRIWVSACSTGEEVYSILILLEEYFERIGKRYLVKVFATDIDEKSLEHASRGTYSEESMNNVSVRRKEKFFTYNGAQYKINENLRNIVIFSKHNLIKDIPFSNLDFITCRNLLIYLDAEAQQNVLSIFHFALNHNGYLFLGKNESTGNMSKYFDPIDSRWNIYKYAGQVKMPRVNLCESRSFKEYQQKSNWIKKEKTRKRMNTSKKYIDKIVDVLEHMYIPKCIIVNDIYEVVYSMGDVNDYVKIPMNKMSTNLFNMIRKDMSIPLGLAINNAIKKNKLCKYKDIRIKEENSYKKINLSVIPFNDNEEGNTYLAILFEEGTTQEYSNKEQYLFTEEKVYEHIEDLEYELNIHREEVNNLIEDLELENEELILANEELQNISEELQTVTEELYMVNNEYQIKLEELSKVNEYYKEMISVSDINIIHLDTELCIKLYTPSMGKLMNLSQVDIGKPFYNYVNTFQYTYLFKDIQSILINLKEIEKIVENKEGNFYKLKITPHLNDKGIAIGVFINIVDISSVLEINKMQEKANEY